jgi:pyruvate/2-oxoacid:ferredoxin oxidoreductase alpha subunit
MTSKKPWTSCPTSRPDGVPDMANAGEGYRFHVTGLTHNEKGYPSMTVKTQDRLVRRLKDKIRNNMDDGLPERGGRPGDADVVVSPTESPRAWRMRAIHMVN